MMKFSLGLSINGFSFVWEKALAKLKKRCRIKVSFDPGTCGGNLMTR
jgi:hypothetical protein